jgi:hypothetical protein
MDGIDGWMGGSCRIFNAVVIVIVVINEDVDGVRM